MTVKIVGLERIREGLHRGIISSSNLSGLALDVAVKNDSKDGRIIYVDGAMGGGAYYTLDDQGKPVHLTEAVPGGVLAGRVISRIQPGGTDTQRMNLPMGLLQEAQHGLYLELTLADAAGANNYTLSSGDLQISDSLKDLFAGPAWGAATNGAQIAIEIPYVEKPEDFQDISVVPFSVYIRNEGDVELEGTNTSLMKAVFVTQDSDGNTKDLVSEKTGPAVGGSRPFNIPSGAILRFDLYLPMAFLSSIRETMAVRVSINQGEHDIDLESAPIDARLINDFINAVADVAPKLTPIPEENLNPLPGASGANTSISSSGSSGTAAKSASHKPPAKPAPTLLAQVESSSYTAPVLITLGALVVARFFYRRRK